MINGNPLLPLILGLSNSHSLGLACGLTLNASIELLDILGDMS